MRRLTVDDILSMRGVSGIAISPDGMRVTYVVTEPVPVERSKDAASSDIWVTDGAVEKRFTNGPGSSASPQWSPDSSKIAFISQRPGDHGNQIYVVTADGKKVQRLSQHGASIASFNWSPDGRRIAFLSTVPLSVEEDRRIALGDDASELSSSDADSSLRPQKLWTMDAATGAEQQVRVGSESSHVTAFSWAPHGELFAVLITDEANMDHEWIRSRVAVADAAKGTITTYCATQGRIASPRWRPDGEAVSFLGASADGREPAASSLYLCEGLNSQAINLTPEAPYTVSSYQWIANSKQVLMTITEKNGRYLARFDTATRKLQRISPDGQVVSSDFSVSSDGTHIALAVETPVRPADVWMGAIGKPLRQVTRLNPGLEGIEYGQSEDISWKAADGLEITGVLIKPVGYKAGERAPLIVLPHGGPEGADLNGFQITWGQFLAAHGYAVLFPNFRGGIGRGVKYTVLDNGDLGGKDFEDVMAGVDDVIARGVADPDRLGIGGWSYGGFMSAWAVTQTNRFKAAIVGSGVSDWYQILAETPVPLWTVQVHFEAWAWDHPEAFRKHSPIEFVQQVKTPVLFFHGDHDNMIPLSQARGYFRALRHYNVPSSLVVFPREGHGVRETAHRIDLYNRMLAWYDKYVKPVQNAAFN